VSNADLKRWYNNSSWRAHAQIDADTGESAGESDSTKKYPPPATSEKPATVSHEMVYKSGITKSSAGGT